MRFERGDLWNALGDADLLVVSINRTITRGGNLVMGAGAARQAKCRFPMLPALFGAQIADGVRDNLLLVQHGEQWFGGLVVKEHWSQPARLDLIESGVTALAAYASAHPRHKIDMHYPGIGLGQLLRADVAPLLLRLPDNVTVWEL